MPRAPEDATEAERARNRRVLVGVVLFFGALTILAALGGFIVWRMVTDSPVADVRKRLGGEADLVVEAQVTPGAKLMRQEGCQEAMVFDTQAMLERADELAGEPLPRSPDQPQYVAVCRMTGSAEGAPGCAALAAAMADRLPLDGKIAMVVSVVDAGGDTGPRCAQVFTPNGGVVGPYNRNLVPLPIEL